MGSDGIAQSFLPADQSLVSETAQYPRQPLAMLEAEYAGAFCLAFRSAHLLGVLEHGGTESDERLARAVVPIAKLLTAKQAVAVTSEAIEACGGAGYRDWQFCCAATGTTLWGRGCTQDEARSNASSFWTGTYGWACTLSNGTCSL